MAEGVVFDLGYRPHEGERLGRGGRPLVGIGARRRAPRLNHLLIGSVSEHPQVMKGRVEDIRMLDDLLDEMFRREEILRHQIKKDALRGALLREKKERFRLKRLHIDPRQKKNLLFGHRKT